MAGEFMVINPRGRRHRRKNRRSRRTHSRKRTNRRRRRTNPFVANARRHHRRRRRTNARRHHRRRRSNPRFGLGGLTSGLMTGVGITFGVVATNISTGLVIKHVPGIPSALSSGPGRIALKAAIGVIALPMLLKAVRQPALARNVQVGGWVSVLLDVYTQYLAPTLDKAIGVSDYELTGMGAYEVPQGLMGPGEVEVLEGIEENIYASPMY